MKETFMMKMRVIGVLVYAALVFFPIGAAGQDLSRYRDVPFGSTVASVIAVTRTSADAVKALYQRPSLIQELQWRPQYALGRASGGVDPAQQVTFRFYDDQLFSITVVYEARLVQGLTNQDIIEGVSAVYGPATLTAAASRGPAPAPPGTINGSTALASWQSADYQFTLMREVYPATFRLIGVSKGLEPLARAAETEAARLDKEEAPRREAERARTEAQRRATAEDTTRATNKSEFRP
jgi:hypothetical protein